jgi:tRNA pseudouridine55 synthase
VGKHLDLDVRVVCSSGTYIRALARDLGAGLRAEGAAVGGHLTALRRTRVGPFAVADAVSADSDELADTLRDPAAVAALLFPTAVLDQGQLIDLAHGKRVELDIADADVVAALTPAGRLAGLVAVKKGAARVLVNYPTAEVLA